MQKVCEGRGLDSKGRWAYEQGPSGVRKASWEEVWSGGRHFVALISGWILPSMCGFVRKPKLNTEPRAWGFVRTQLTHNRDSQPRVTFPHFLEDIGSLQMPLVAPIQEGCGPVSMVDTEESAKPLQIQSAPSSIAAQPIKSGGPMLENLDLWQQRIWED